MSPPAADAQPVAGLPEWLAPLASQVPHIRGEDLTAFLPPADPPPREGAVLVLFGDGPDGPDLLLTERAHHMRAQPGQVSFPGGSLDPGEDAVAAALREGHEETGLDPADVAVFGVLPRLWLPPRNFAVAPVLGYWRHDAHVEVVNPVEVHAVFRVTLEHLRDPAQRYTVRHPLGWEGPAWLIGPGRDVVLWGFTAGIIDALLEFAGWARPWDRDRVLPLPEHLVEWERVARLLGVEVPDGEPFDPVAAGLLPPGEEAVEVDRDHRRDGHGPVGP